MLCGIFTNKKVQASLGARVFLLACLFFRSWFVQNLCRYIPALRRIDSQDARVFSTSSRHFAWVWA